MGTFNSNSRFDTARHSLDERLDAFKSETLRFIDRVMTRPDGTASRVRTWSTQATNAIKTHPYVAVGIAMGLGYIIVRGIRR
jgi:hypothetical protein